MKCAIDGYVYFQWNAASHDLMLLPSKAAYDTCDFSSATTLVPLNAPSNSATGSTSYYLPCGSTPNTVKYVACSVASHCSTGGQKLTVHVSADEYALDKTTTPPTALLHSDSLSRVMTLLGHRVDAATGFTYLDRGYESDAAAEVSLEMIWCLESHCPASALDFDSSATKTSCLAQVYNLGGFVSRKRPTPDYAHAEGYYLTALSHEPNHCPTLGYLTELYLMRSNVSAASATALRLCTACGATSSMALQIKQSFDTGYPAVASWPCGAPSAPPPPLMPGMVMVHEVSTKFTVEGTLDSFDRTAFVRSFAQVAEVAESTVRLDVSAGSVVVVATVTTPSPAAATALVATLVSITTSAAAASSALGLKVLTVEPPRVAAVSRDAAELDQSILEQIRGAGDSSSTGALPIDAIIGASAGTAAAILLLSCYCWRGRRKVSRAKELPVTKTKTKTSAAAAGAAPAAVQLEVPVTPESKDIALPSAPSLPPSPPSSAKRGEARVAPSVV